MILGLAAAGLLCYNYAGPEVHIITLRAALAASAHLMGCAAKALCILGAELCLVEACTYLGGLLSRT